MILDGFYSLIFLPRLLCSPNEGTWRQGRRLHSHKAVESLIFVPRESKKMSRKTCRPGKSSQVGCSCLFMPAPPMSVRTGRSLVSIRNNHSSLHYANYTNYNIHDLHKLQPVIIIQQSNTTIEKNIKNIKNEKKYKIKMNDKRNRIK